MRPGPSFSEIGIAALAAVALAAAAPAPPRALPGPGGSDAPSATAPASIPCPRCGYRNDPDARHCVACGWDLAILVGDADQRRLQAIGEAVVGVVVAKEYVSASSMLAPKYSKWLRLLAPDEGEHGKHRHFGTAFPLGRAGLFVTSARLLDRAVEARVRTFDNRQFPAEILAYDLPTGIGLIKADVPGVKPLALGERGPEPPEGAWVICFPVALEGKVVRYLPQSLHRGQVTALAQTGTGLASFEDLVRSDHSIPEGCPGAPLIDRRGGLVGMVLDSPEPALTYSVPAPAFVSLVDTLARGEVPERPYFGMGLVGPDARRRDKFALAASASQALVAYVIPGSPAEASGVRAGDLLLAVGGEKVGTPSAAAARLLRASVAGGPEILAFLRGSQPVELRVPPTRRPGRILLAPVDEIQESLEANLVEVTTGPTSQQGLRVSDLVHGGRGEIQGYRDGDIITSVNDKPVRHLDAFNAIVRSQNVQIFGDEKKGGTAPIPLYVLRMDVKTAEGGKERRDYMNLCPFVLAPPVY